MGRHGLILLKTGDNASLVPLHGHFQMDGAKAAMHVFQFKRLEARAQGILAVQGSETSRAANVGINYGLDILYFGEIGNEMGNKESVHEMLVNV